MARPAPARVALAVGAAAAAGSFLVPGEARPPMVVAAGVVACAAIWWAARRTLGGNRLPWYLYGFAQLFFGCLDVVWIVPRLTRDAGAGFPSAPDVLAVVASGAVATSVVVLVLRFGSLSGRSALVDAAVVTSAFAGGEWVLLLEPELVSGPNGHVVAAVYIVNVLMLAGFARFFSTPAWRTSSYRYLLLATVLLIAADEAYRAAPEVGVGAPWIAALLVLGHSVAVAAELDPSMRELSLARGDRGLARATLLLLAAALFAAPALAAVELAHGLRPDPWLVAAAAAELAAVVLAAGIGVVRGVARLRRAEREARADAARALAQVAEQNRHLVELGRLKDEFLFSVSHDLRTPLLAIDGSLDLLRDDARPEQLPFVEVAGRNVQRTLRMVEDLLLAARLQGGTLELALEAVDVAEEAAACAAALRPLADSAAVALEVVGAAGPVLGDRARLAQAIDNLLSNALKFTPSGGSVVVRVTAEPGRVVLAVADSGIGVDPAERPHLFDRFYRGAAATAAATPGTGLGLYLVKAIVEAHGGSVVILDREGGGAVAHVELPAAQRPDQPR